MATAAGHRRPPTGAAAVPFATYNLLAPWTEGDLTAGLLVARVRPVPRTHSLDDLLDAVDAAC